MGLDIQLEDKRQVITIEGIQYTYNFFRELGIHGMTENKLFKIVKREDKCLSIMMIEDNLTPT